MSENRQLNFYVKQVLSIRILFNVVVYLSDIVFFFNKVDEIKCCIIYFKHFTMEIMVLFIPVPSCLNR